MSRRSPREVIAPTPPLALAPGVFRAGWPTRVVLACAAVFPLMYLAVALLRLRFPYELEWMEGSMIEHMDRVRQGLPIYVRPSLEFTPFLYPPVYYWVTAAVASVVGGGFLPLRLTSIVASIACLALIYAIVARGARSRIPAVLATCLFAASYREGGAWLDLGRVDSLGLALLLAGVLVLRHGLARPAAAPGDDPEAPPEPGESARAALGWGIAGGVCFALSALTKQSAISVAAALALGLLAADRRRFGGYLITLTLALGGATLALNAGTDQWYRFYVLDLPREHPIIGQLLRLFWIQDLMGPLGLALAIGAVHFFAGRVRWPLLAFDLSLIGGLVLTGYATRIRVGSFENVVIPSYVGVALAFGLGLNALIELAGRVTPAARARAERLVALVCFAQFALLLYKPWQQIPEAADVRAGEQIVESLRRVQGEVWIPSHPYLARMAGKHGHAHQLAMYDVMRPRQDGGEIPERHLLVDSLRTALREHRYAAVVLDGEGWFKDEAQPYYELKARMYADNEPELFWPMTGYHTRPDFVWLPKPAGAP